jgi:hypothetical protein
MPRGIDVLQGPVGVISILAEGANEVVPRAAAAMAPGSAVGVDGSWNDARRARRCFGCFIDLFQKRAFDFTFHRMPPGAQGDARYCSEQAVEAFAHRKLVRVWIDGEDVAFLARDQEASVDEMAQEWDVVQSLDRNHVRKSRD